MPEVGNLFVGLLCLLFAQVMANDYDESLMDFSADGGSDVQPQVGSLEYFMPYEELAEHSASLDEMEADSCDAHGAVRAAYMDAGPLSSSAEKSCLSAHNKYRAIHGVAPLKWDERIAKFAQGRSTDMVRRSYFNHVPGTPYGENLYWTSWGATACAALVKGWYDEIRLYNYNMPTFSMSTGHFTQVVWRNTRRLGCGMARGARGLTLTCNYYPPGNVAGLFRQNVQPPKKGDGGGDVRHQKGVSTPEPQEDDPDHVRRPLRKRGGTQSQPLTGDWVDEPQLRYQ